MTLDKHTIQGLSAFTTKTLRRSEFETRMIDAGYYEVGTASAQGGRIKIWFTFTQSQPQIWEILYKQQNYTVTFYPDIYDEKSSLRLINFGEPLFEELLSAACKIFEYKRTNLK